MSDLYSDSDHTSMPGKNGDPVPKDPGNISGASETGEKKPEAAANHLAPPPSPSSASGNRSVGPRPYPGNTGVPTGYNSANQGAAPRPQQTPGGYAGQPDRTQYTASGYGGAQPRNNTASYSFGTAPTAEVPPPKKPKKHFALKAIAFALCLVIVGLGSIQVYKFMDDSRLSPEVSESSNDSSEKEDKPAASKSDRNDGDETSQSTSEPLPGLFDLAARKDAKSIPDIVDEIMPSVVGVSSTFEITENYSSWGFGFPSGGQTSQAIGTGTGIVMTEDGYILTNAHVIYDSSEEYNAGEAVSVSVLFSDETEYDAKIYAYDVETDLAILKVDDTGFTPAEFGDSSQLRIGELVIAVGNPLGFELFGSVTSGIVSALDRKLSINDQSLSLIQTDTAINQGNSGGPLLNSCGQVIGINSSKLSASYGMASIEGLGFAIPINEAKAIIDDLINYRHVTGRPQIGITTVDITEAYSNYLGLPMGLYVRGVGKGSAAEEAGIRPGDIIIGINDEAVTTMDELNAVKNQFKAGDTVTLKINRDGEDIDVSLTLHDASEELEYIEP